MRLHRGTKINSRHFGQGKKDWVPGTGRMPIRASLSPCRDFTGYPLTYPILTHLHHATSIDGGEGADHMLAVHYLPIYPDLTYLHSHLATAVMQPTSNDPVTE